MTEQRAGRIVGDGIAHALARGDDVGELEGRISGSDFIGKLTVAEWSKVSSFGGAPGILMVSENIYVCTAGSSAIVHLPA